MKMDPAVAAIRLAVRTDLADCSAGDLVMVAVSGGADSLALAAAACGADGLIVECHPDPRSARCDGPQAITLDALLARVEDR